MNAYDVETYVDQNNNIVPYCVCFYINRKIHHEYGLLCINKSIKKIFSFKFKKKTFFIHNLNFDGFLILEACSANSYIIGIFAKKLSFYSLSIRENNKEIKFKCSYKILPMSLSKIASAFNFNQKTIFPYKFIQENNLYYIGPCPDACYFNSEFEHNKFKDEHAFFDVMRDSVTYCKNDVNITKNFLKNLADILKIFKIKIEDANSAPSLALKIFQKNFNKNIIKTSYNQTFEKIGRKAYFGGRCEVYGNPEKDEKIFHFDFTGMYAQCMLEKYPTGSYKIIENPKDVTLPGIYWIDYYSENINRPVLPHHRLLDGKLLFCNGENSGAFWYEEIQLFIEKGGFIKKITYALVFDGYDHVFTEYINFFTELRKKSEAHNMFGKLMINSIYGRMGMSDIETHSFIDKKENLKKLSLSIDIISHKEINNIALIEAFLNKKLINKLKIKKNKIKNNVIIAACITAKARIKLYRAQESVIKHGGRVLYSDTDSVFAAYKKDISDETHGEIFWDSKKKDTLIKKAIFISPKSYAIKYYDNTSIVKIKGYNEKNVSYDDIQKKYNIQEKLILKKYKFLSKKNLKLFYQETEKNFDLNFYDKRYFINKYETLPYFYENFMYKKAV